MEQHRIDTQNAIELYLRHLTRERAVDVITSLARWPFWDRSQNAGKFMAAVDALSLKHGAFVSSLRWRFAVWLIRKAVLPERPAWNDYWLLYWVLTKDRPLVAGVAIRELHRRAFHLLEARDNPEWAFTRDAALDLVRRECIEHPEFREAMLAEIADSPCKAHAGLGEGPFVMRLK